MEVIGRGHAKEILDLKLRTTKSELVAVLGRRRIGKTYLIREYLREQTVFRYTGLYKGDLAEHMERFAIIGTAGFQIIDCGGIVKPPKPTDNHFCSSFAKVAGRSNGTFCHSAGILQNKSLADRNDKSITISPNPFTSDIKVQNAAGSAYEILDASGSVLSSGRLATQDETS